MLRTLSAFIIFLTIGLAVPEAGARASRSAAVLERQRGEGLYDRQSKIGKLDKAWDEAVQRGWTVVDMAKDWKTVFAFERGSTGVSQ
ncbi:hypothetical protein [Bradyrhizobium monzae]